MTEDGCWAPKKSCNYRRRARFMQESACKGKAINVLKSGLGPAGCNVWFVWCGKTPAENRETPFGPARSGFWDAGG